MQKKKQTVYKTEEQLKEEARLKELEAQKALASAKPKSNFEKKLENFIYHYKWLTIFVVCSVILAGVFIKDMVFRVRPDTSVVVVSSQYISPDATDALSVDLAELAYDYNGDKKTVIEVSSIWLPDESNQQLAQEEYANVMKLTVMLAAAEEYIFLLDDKAYARVTQMGLTENDPPGTDNIFLPESFPADSFGFPDMRFYLRKSTSAGEYYAYCEKLFFSLSE